MAAIAASRRAVAVVVLLLAALGPARAAAATPAPLAEYEVKAAFLHNFARFVEWPEAAASGPLVVGVLGEDPFGPLLDRTFAGKTLRNQPIHVRRLARVEDAAGVHVVFISRSEEGRLADILRPLRGTPVLTVSDIPDFAARGGIIGLRLEDQKVRFDIDPNQAARAGLKLSSQLLKLARLVPSREGR